MANFLLVHGAWHGAWCWRDVVPLLEREGHRVHAVTLTGVGERVHLMSPAITLETFIDDVRNAMDAEEMDRVVLAVDGRFRIWPGRLFVDVLSFVLKQRAQARREAVPIATRQ